MTTSPPASGWPANQPHPSYYPPPNPSSPPPPGHPSRAGSRRRSGSPKTRWLIGGVAASVAAVAGVAALVWTTAGAQSQTPPPAGSEPVPSQPTGNEATGNEATGNEAGGPYAFRDDICQAIDVSAVEALLPVSSLEEEPASMDPAVPSRHCFFNLGGEGASGGLLTVTITVHEAGAASAASEYDLAVDLKRQLSGEPSELAGSWEEGVEFLGAGNSDSDIFSGYSLLVRDQNLLVAEEFTINQGGRQPDMVAAAEQVLQSVLAVSGG
jgi:hypothetical protein